MDKVIVASKNPVKIKAVKNAFKKMFENQKFEFISISTNSEVSNQPNTSNETFIGAKNRANNASNEYKNAKFYVGIEGGIEKKQKEMESFAWVVIKSENKYGKAKTGSFFLPNKIIKLINEGMELGEADDIVFKDNNSKQKNGAVGILTKNVIDRKKYYMEAIILALIPFKNKELY
ncbi:MAG: inosine/xanthosine triphosphatase [Nanoarchaeota archaeon]